MRKASKGFSQKKYLDGEALFRKYHELGRAKSIFRLQNWCKENRMINPVTGKPPTHMAIWFAMWRWALRPENQEVAKNLYNEFLGHLSRPLLDNAGWREFMLERAKVCFNSGMKDNSFFSWKIENGYK